jgi:hypothetical protein
MINPGRGSEQEMTERGPSWRRIREEGAEWEARVLPGPAAVDPGREGEEELLEFVCVDGSRKARQVAVPTGSFQGMDDQALHRAFLQARPIGGDHYGRPGKPMDDAR